jgi:hypothetical protein
MSRREDEHARCDASYESNSGELLPGEDKPHGESSRLAAQRRRRVNNQGDKNMIVTTSDALQYGNCDLPGFSCPPGETRARDISVHAAWIGGRLRQIAKRAKLLKPAAIANNKASQRAEKGMRWTRITVCKTQVLLLQPQRSMSLKIGSFQIQRSFPNGRIGGGLGMVRAAKSLTPRAGRQI